MSALCGRDGTDIPPCGSSSGSAIPVPATPATATTSVSWWSMRSPSATASRRGASRAWRWRGPAARRRARAAAAAGNLQTIPRAVAEAAHFYKLGLPEIVVFRRDRSAARQGTGEDRRRGRRPQRAALDLGPYRQRLHAACASASAILASRSWCIRTCSPTSPRASGHGSRLCAASSPTTPSSWPRVRTRTFQNKIHLAMQAKGFLDLKEADRTTDRRHGRQSTRETS